MVKKYQFPILRPFYEQKNHHLIQVYVHNTVTVA